jgi:DNA uptake protein ComE-like DNA-binding protein
MLNLGVLRSPIAVLSLCGTLALLGGCAQDGGSPRATPASTETSASSTTPGKIDINQAPITELDKLELPGTKPSLSERIQSGRPYSQPEDLVSKKVISPEEFKLIKNLVTASKKK